MDQPLDCTLEAARGTPGSAEFLSTLLKSANNTKCPHFPKIRPSLASKVPHCLGFFALTNPTISWLRTDRVCYNCYRLAVPYGFIIWSTGCLGAQHGPALPPCFEAGTEGYGGNATANPQKYPPACIVAGQEEEDAFNWLKEQKQPFFFDFLHLSRPFNGAAVDEAAEIARVRAEIHIAFENASKCLVTQKTDPDTDKRLSAASSRLITLPSGSVTIKSKARRSIPNTKPRKQTQEPTFNHLDLERDTSVADSPVDTSAPRISIRNINVNTTQSNYVPPIDRTQRLSLPTKKESEKNDLGSYEHGSTLDQGWASRELPAKKKKVKANMSTTIPQDFAQPQTRPLETQPVHLGHMQGSQAPANLVTTARQGLSQTQLFRDNRQIAFNNNRRAVQAQQNVMPSAYIAPTRLAKISRPSVTPSSLPRNVVQPPLRAQPTMRVPARVRNPPFSQPKSRNLGHALRSHVQGSVKQRSNPSKPNVSGSNGKKAAIGGALAGITVGAAGLMTYEEYEQDPSRAYTGFEDLDPDDPDPDNSGLDDPYLDGGPGTGVNSDEERYLMMNISLITKAMRSLKDNMATILKIMRSMERRLLPKAKMVIEVKMLRITKMT